MADERQDLDELPDDVRWRLQKSDGYIDLGMLDRAAAELESIPATFRETTSFLQCKLHFAFKKEDWPQASPLAGELQRRTPLNPDFWIQHAYAVRRTSGIELAREILIEARMRFPGIVIISFNLACYECRLNRLEEARKFLHAAMDLDPHCREMALEDEDLKELWPELDLT